MAAESQRLWKSEGPNIGFNRFHLIYATPKEKGRDCLYLFQGNTTLPRAYYLIGWCPLISARNSRGASRQESVCYVHL